MQTLLNLSPSFFFICCTSIEKDNGDFDIYFNYSVCADNAVRTSSEMSRWS